MKSESEVTQSCPTSDPMDCSLPGSSVHGIFQAKVLEWGAIAFSGKSIYSGLILSWRVIHNTFCHEREMKEWEWQAEPNSFFARIPHNFFVAFISTLSASSFLKIFSHFGHCSKLSIPFLLLLPGFSPVVVSGDYCLLWNMSYSYCSWGSQGKNTEVVCHSHLQWTTFCQISPPWPHEHHEHFELNKGQKWYGPNRSRRC